MMMRGKMLLSALITIIWGINSYGGGCGGCGGKGGGGFSKRPATSHVPKYALSFLDLEKAKEEAVENKKPIVFVIAESESSKDDDFGKLIRQALKKLKKETVLVFITPKNKCKAPELIKKEIENSKSELNLIFCDSSLSENLAFLEYKTGDKKRDFLKEFQKKKKEILKELEKKEKDDKKIE